jgi:hypothetical protein
VKRADEQFLREPPHIGDPTPEAVSQKVGETLAAQWGLS